MSLTHSELSKLTDKEIVLLLCERLQCKLIDKNFSMKQNEFLLEKDRIMIVIVKENIPGFQTQIYWFNEDGSFKEQV